MLHRENGQEEEPETNTMSILQHPRLALSQIEWYLEHRQEESFPGAFLLSAGNLARQVLEQVLFILAFYSKMPRRKYLKSSKELRTAATILKALQEIEPSSGQSYLELARRRGPRIAKFARYPRSLDHWRRVLNEPSHFSNPASRRSTRESDIWRFVSQFDRVFVDTDGFLVTAAVNELRSGGFIRAVLANNSENTPGIEYITSVTPSNLELEHGKLVLHAPSPPIQVIPDTQEVPLRSKKRILLVQHSCGMFIQCKMVTQSGFPVNLTNMETMLNSFTREPGGAKQVVRRLRKLGIEVEGAEFG